MAYVRGSTQETPAVHIFMHYEFDYKHMKTNQAKFTDKSMHFDAILPTIGYFLAE